MVRSMTMSRLQAYAMLTEHALDHVWYVSQDVDDEVFGCCPKCCAPCGALQYLDQEGILDLVLAEWGDYSDGTRRDLTNNAMYRNGKVNRELLLRAWNPKINKLDCYHDNP